MTLAPTAETGRYPVRSRRRPRVPASCRPRNGVPRAVAGRVAIVAHRDAERFVRRADPADEGREPYTPLWLLCLYAIGKLTDRPEAMQAVHLLIATTSIFVFVRHAPFRRWERALFPLGYFMLYEYAIISRHYGLGVLFVSLFLRHAPPRELPALDYALIDRPGLEQPPGNPDRRAAAADALAALEPSGRLVEADGCECRCQLPVPAGSDRRLCSSWFHRDWPRTTTYTRDWTRCSPSGASTPFGTPTFPSRITRTVASCGTPTFWAPSTRGSPRTRRRPRRSRGPLRSRAGRSSRCSCRSSCCSGPSVLSPRIAPS